MTIACATTIRLPAKEEIISQLQTPNNKSIIEDLTLKDIILYRELVTAHGKASRSDQYKNLELEDELAVAKNFVESITKTRTDSPKIYLTGSIRSKYNLNGVIGISIFFPVNQTKAMRHEYVHHVQNKAGLFQELENVESEIFTEGQASAIELQLDELTSKQQIMALEQRISYLLATNISRKTKKLFSNTVHNLKNNYLYHTEYTAGYTAFAIAESKYGRRIYADTLQEPMLLLDVLRGN